MSKLKEIEKSIRSKSGSTCLLAVSKYQPCSKIIQMYREGQRDFGENYIKELVDKTEQLNDYDINWHFIGKLQ